MKIIVYLRKNNLQFFTNFSRNENKQAELLISYIEKICLNFVSVQKNEILLKFCYFKPFGQSGGADSDDDCDSD